MVVLFKEPENHLFAVDCFEPSRQVFNDSYTRVHPALQDTVLL